MLRTPSARLGATLLLAGLLAPAARPDFTYADFTSTAGLNLVGGATTNNGNLFLTLNQTFTAGGVWHQTAQNVSGGFDTTFSFRMSNPGGADGMAFVLQNDSPTVLGSCGGAMGYSSGTSTGCTQGTNADIQNALVVELDIWNNTEYQDTSFNHVSVQRSISPNELCHNLNSLASVDAPFNLNDAATHVCRIRHDGLETLEVYLDDLGTPLLTVAVKLTDVGLANGAGWVGITGATGGVSTFHIVEDWTFDSCTGARVPYGTGCPGTGGFVPELSLGGCPEEGTQIALEVSNGLGGANAILLFGLAQGSTPVGASGCSVLVSPLVGPQLTLPLSPGNPGTGSLFLPAVLPLGTAGASFTMQIWVIDPASPAGAAASNGLLVTVG